MGKVRPLDLTFVNLEQCPIVLRQEENCMCQVVVSAVEKREGVLGRKRLLFYIG